MADSELKEKIVMITGASSGFGRGAALQFAKEGASVVLAARREQALNEVARQCESSGGRTLVAQTDVARENDVATLAQGAVSVFGRIDVRVNNAGAGALGRFEDVPLADHVQVIQTDLPGTLYGSYLAMKQSAALRQELVQDKVDTIHVCTVMPTTFDTPFFEHAAQYTGHEASPIPPTPEDKVSVGTAAKVANFAHQFFPGLVESTMARQTRKSEFDNAAAGENTSGSIPEPTPAGTGVSGGWKQ